MPVLSPAWLDLVVNSVNKGTVLAQLSGDDVWLAAEDLEAAGLRVEGGTRVERSGRSLVSLASLRSQLTFTLDEVNVAVRIVAARTVLGTTRLDLARFRPPPDLLRREPASAYLNWALTGDSERRRAGHGELGVAVGPGLLLSGMTVDRENGAVRGLTTAYWDDRARLVRWTAGDLVAPPADPLGGTGLVLGGSVARDLALDPYLLQQPYPRTSVFSATPALLEVWVDDALVRRVQVQPGTVDLENLPVNVGLSEVRTVLRDPFGREVSASTFALLGSSNLAPGLVDWGVALGATRRNFATRSFDYGGPLGQAHLRAGLTDVLTVGGRLEGGDGLVSGGGTVALATPVAELEATAAASVDAGEPGAAVTIAARRLGRRASLVGQLRWDSGRYANGSLDAGTDRALVRGLVSGTLGLTDRLSLIGELAAERRRDLGHDGRAVARLTLGLPRGFLASLSVSRSYSDVAPPATEVLASIAMVLRGGTVAEVQGGTGSGGASEFSQVSVTRSAPAGPGLGYRVAARGGDGSLLDAEARGQTGFGRAEVIHSETDPWNAARTRYTWGQVSSGIVLLDGRLFATQPVEGAYALVRVEDAPGVEVYLQGQDMGRTDRHGDLLVTGLQPYQGNRISIRDSDLPLDFRVDEVERTIAPRERGGSIERFRVARELSVTGRLVLDLDGKEVPPEFGELSVELPGRRAVSPIGHGGAFWLEGITEGAHDALVKWEGNLCRFVFDVPKDAAGVLDLGTVRCVQML